MGKRRKNRIWLKITAIFCLTVIAISLGVIIFNFIYGPLEIRILDARFSVDDRMGFDLTKNDSVLSFGKALPGNSVSKSINIENEREFPIQIRAFASDEINSYLNIDGETTIQPQENKSIGFVLNIPKNMSFGNYSGKIILKIYRYCSNG